MKADSPLLHKFYDILSYINIFKARKSPASLRLPKYKKAFKVLCVSLSEESANLIYSDMPL